MNPFIVNTPGKVIFGNNSLENAGRIARDFGTKAFLLCDDFSLNHKDIFEKLKNKLEESGVSYTREQIYGHKQVLPSLIKEYDFKDTELIIALGGENVINTAKALKEILSEAGERKGVLFGGRGRKTIPLLAMPAGLFASSAVTNQMYTIDYEAEKYYSVSQKDIYLPDVVIADPKICFIEKNRDLWFFILRLMGGIIETYVAVDGCAFSELLAGEGVKYLVSCIAEMLSDKGDISEDFSERLCYASLLAGFAEGYSQRGVLRGMAQEIISRYAVDVNEVYGALIYEATLTNMRRVQFFESYEETSLKYAGLGSVFSGIDYSYDKKDVLMRAVTEYLSNLTESFGAVRLKDLGIEEEDIYLISESAKQFANPAQLANSEIDGILKNSY